VLGRTRLTYTPLTGHRMLSNFKPGSCSRGKCRPRNSVFLGCCCATALSLHGCGTRFRDLALVGFFFGAQPVRAMCLDAVWDAEPCTPVTVDYRLYRSAFDPIVLTRNAEGGPFLYIACLLKQLKRGEWRSPVCGGTVLLSCIARTNVREGWR
jgi:hypothetical protein